jgi:hypothetical protein
MSPTGSDAMIPPDHTDGSLPITTSSGRAAGLYRLGLEQLRRSPAEAGASFARAVAEDEGFALAIAAAAVAARPPPDPDESTRVLDRALRACRSATRRERQHVEIVAYFVHGELSRATALAAAHLSEFPRDTLIAHLFGHD